jgi:NodT family efflux transporter outer membrane factor (OMF) lipoprotein
MKSPSELRGEEKFKSPSELRATTKSRSARLGQLGALVLFALSACASYPSSTAAPKPKPVSTYAADRTLTAADADWPAADWWKAYGDPQLDRLITEALEGAPTLAQAQARLRRAVASTAAARAAGLPALSASGGVAEARQSEYQGIPPEFVPKGYIATGSVALNFNWELDFWGKNRAALAAATSEARAAVAEAAEARLMLSTSVAAAYADLTRLYAERDVAARMIESQNKTRDLVTDRVNNGLAAEAEQRQAEAEPLQSQADLTAIDERISLARNQIAALLGQGPDRGLAIEPPAQSIPKAFGLPANLPAELIGRRPDIVAARWRAEASVSRIKRDRAAFYPNVNLAGLIGAAALPVRDLTSSGSEVGSIGPAVTLPLFEGGLLRANLAASEAERDEAIATYDGAVVEALREVADVATSVRSLRVELSQSSAALARSEEAYRMAGVRYRTGLSTYSALLQVEQGVLVRRCAVADLRARAFALDVALVRALGGGFTSRDT